MVGLRAVLHFTELRGCQFQLLCLFGAHFYVLVEEILGLIVEPARALACRLE